jgi:hypothetical protein
VERESFHEDGDGVLGQDSPVWDSVFEPEWLRGH